MPRIEYTVKILNRLNKTKLRQDVIKAKESSPEYRAEIRRVFQMANRRIQNIESAGLMSPAVAALNKGDITGYSKFSMSGKTWEELKLEYGRAVAFLRQPTSTATGVRQYNAHLQRVYDLTPDEFNLMARDLQGKLSSLSDSAFVDRYLMRYKDFTGEMEQSAADISTQIESEAESIRRAIDAQIQKEADEVVELASKIEENFFNTPFF
jgi:hypothetical protein